MQEMFNDLLNEVKQEKKNKIEGNKNVNVNLGPAQTNKNVAKKAEVDDIEDMLANLWVILITLSRINSPSLPYIINCTLSMWPHS